MENYLGDDGGGCDAAMRRALLMAGAISGNRMTGRGFVSGLFVFVLAFFVAMRGAEQERGGCCEVYP